MAADLRGVAIALAGASVFLNLYAPQAVLPVLAQDFSASAAEMSLTITATTLAVALTAPFTGAVADVLGRKRVIAAAILALAVPTAMTAFAATLPAFVFWRFVQGLLMPPIFAVTLAYIGDEWPPTEATGMTGLYTAATGLSGFLGRLLPGLLNDAIGWRGAFLVDAAVTFAFGLGVVALLPRERQFVRATHLGASLAQMVRHVGNPRLLGTFALGFGILFNFIAIFTFVAFHLAAPPFSLSATALGMLFIVYLFGSAAAPMVGRAVARFGRRSFIIGVIAVWMAGVALMLAPSLPAIVAGLAIAATCGFLCQASSTSYVAVSAAEGVSSAVGLYLTAFYAGGSVGALAGGFAWTLAGWTGVVVAVIAMLAAMALLVWAAWKPAPATS